VSTAVVVEQLVSRALEEAVSRIVEKVSEGKKLSDREVTVLVMSLMVRRFDDLKEYVDGWFNSIERRIDGLERRMESVERRVGSVEKRVESVEKRIEGLENRVEGLERGVGSLEKRIEGLENRLNVVHSEVSSIKTDIIKMMRELLERAYGK
jgi:chromosome segregation ATPase